MNIFFLLAFVALLATIATMILGIRSMTHGGAEDREASTRLMFQRVEFQAAALALILAGVFLASGWLGQSEPESDRLTISLGVVPAAMIREQYRADSAEAAAYGGIPDDDAIYLVTAAVHDRTTGERIEDATIGATVGRLGMSGESKALRPASFAGAVTFGNYFHMPQSGIYQIDLRVDRPDVGGSDVVRLQYHRS